MSIHQYFNTLIVTYLVESHVLEKKRFVSEYELIRTISSMSAIFGTKENIALPSENKMPYVEQINKNCGTLMIVIDQMLSAGYLIKEVIRNMNYYQVNLESEYIKKFIRAHGSAYKYISHPSYAISVGSVNQEEDLLKKMEKIMKKKRKSTKKILFESDIVSISTSSDSESESESDNDILNCGFDGSDEPTHTCFESVSDCSKEKEE